MDNQYNDQNFNEQNYGEQNYSEQTYAQPTVTTTTDPDYEAKASGFLKKAIIACILAGLPIAGIVAIFMGSGNRKDILNYLAAGGQHTGKIKTSSVLSRAAFFGGIGYTIFWGFYILYFIFVFGAIFTTAYVNR